MENRTAPIPDLSAKLKAVERAARQAKLASLSALASSVVHEIRNPLTATNVRRHNLKRNLSANSSEQEGAPVIGHEIRRLERIVPESRNRTQATHWPGVTHTTMREKFIRFGLRPAGEELERS